jgi:hypothetical protein
VSLHLALAVVAGVLAALVGGLAIVGRLRGAMPRFAIDRTVLAAEAVIGLAAASGLVQLATGSGPHDGLHLIYAAVALLALPVGRAWRGLVRGPRTVPLVIAAAVLLGVLVRLAQTG